MGKLIAACPGAGGSLAAAALRAELRPARLADLGPRARALPARHDRRAVLEAAAGVRHGAVRPLGEVDHELPAALWMAVARAGALLALAFAFRLAARLGGRRDRRRARRRGRRGGAVPDARLVPVRGARERGADRRGADAVGDRAPPRRARRATALVLGALACLLRPELFPFLGLYGLWAWRAAPRAAPAGGGASSWSCRWRGSCPDWLGSGHPVRRRARRPAASRPGACRWRAPLAARARRACTTTPACSSSCSRSRRSRWRSRGVAPPCSLLAARGARGGGAFVAMTQAGFSGNPRYVLPALALFAVLAGAGAAHLAQACAALAGRRSAAPRRPAWTPLAGAALGCAALALVGGGFFDARVVRMQGRGARGGRAHAAAPRPRARGARGRRPRGGDVRRASPPPTARCRPASRGSSACRSGRSRAPPTTGSSSAPRAS